MKFFHRGNRAETESLCDVAMRLEVRSGDVEICT